MITKGIDRDRSCCLNSTGRAEKTSTTPSGRRWSTPSIHSGLGEWRVPLSVRTTPAPWSLATFSTPLISSIAQMLSSSWKTSSISGASRADRVVRR